MSRPLKRASHISKSDVFADIGFSEEKALAFKFKATILSAILDEVRRRKLRQADLVRQLNEHQPVVSNLLRGKISQMSIEKLLAYAHRLHLQLDVRRPARRASIAGNGRSLAS
jgi:predicted XRE-type DNA-binding protein